MSLRPLTLTVAFRGEMVVGRFSLDFLAPSVRLVVEVDGGVHERKRTAGCSAGPELRRLGYHALRASAGEVLRELEVVVQRVLVALERLR